MSESNENRFANVRLLLRCGFVLLNFVRSTTADASLEIVTPPVNHGDSPHWCQATGSVYFVDRAGVTVHRLEVASKKFYTAKLSDSKEASFIVPVDGASNTYAIGTGKVIGIYTWDGVSKDPITATSTIPVGDGSDVIYTGKADPAGRLYVSMQNGCLYSVGPDKTVTQQMSTSGAFRGMAWCPSSSVFYRVNSVTRQVLKYAYTADTGTVSPDGTSVFDFPVYAFTTHPDGMTVDATGNIWVSLGGSASTFYIDPKNKTGLNTLDLRSDVCTSVTFGDPGLDAVYVTTLGAVSKCIGTGIKGVADVAAKITV